MIEKLTVLADAFENNGKIPREHTGFGADTSPAFTLPDLKEEVVSIAIIMDDLDIPFRKQYNHWVIWNIPRMTKIPANIPYGPMVPSLDNAIQGMGYGKNRYRGPKQPFFIHSRHRYLFQFYGFDCKFAFDSTTTKKKLMDAMQGHILQQGSIMGTYKRGE